MIPSRRAALAGLAAGLAAGPRRASGANAPKRIVALEWSLVSMLLSIGIVPVATGEVEAYRIWVGAPELPPGIADVGLRNEPSLEAIAALRPDLILVSPLSRSVAPRLAAVAPVREIAPYTREHAPLRLLERELRALAAEFGRPEDAERVLAGTSDLFERVRARLAGRVAGPLLVASFLDARHLRVFGPGSLFDDVLARIGLRNAWTASGNDWGQELVGVEALARFTDARLAIVEPVPADIRLDGSRPGLWASLAPVRAGRVLRLPAVWPAGDHLAARRFAALLAAALDPEGEARVGRG